MQLTEDLTYKVLTGLTYGHFEADADEPAEGDEALQEWVNEMGKVVGQGGENGKGLLSAVATFAERQSEHVGAHELADYISETYRGAGFSIGETLREYAKNDKAGDLGKLYDALDRAGGVDSFDWAGYPDLGTSYMSGFEFVEVAVTGQDVHSVYLFLQR